MAKNQSSQPRKKTKTKKRTTKNATVRVQDSMPPPPQLALVVDAAGWKTIPRLKAHIQKAADAVASHLPARYRFPFAATVLLTGNARIRGLNRDFRGMDKPTNVLSFPQFAPSELPKIGKKRGVTGLGDVALALAYTKKEAKETNKLLINHVSHLVIHGLLHLFGYDHLVDNEAEAMERLETKIMQSIGLPAPYAPEVSAKPRRQTTRRQTIRHKQ